MKYNRTEIMKRAWEIRNQDLHLYRKEACKPFGVCLKWAWDEARSAMKAKNSLSRYIIDDEQKAETAPINKVEWGWKIPLNWVIEKEVYNYRMVNGTPFFNEDMVEASTKKAVKIQGAWFPKSVCEFVKIA